MYRFHFQSLSKVLRANDMTLPREAVEHLLDETEQEHRVAHALLMPLKMYVLFDEEEIKGLPQLYRVPVPKRYGLSETGKKIVLVPVRIAVFKLLQLDQINPPRWAYGFLGWETPAKGKPDPEPPGSE